MIRVFVVGDIATEPHTTSKRGKTGGIQTTFVVLSLTTKTRINCLIELKNPTFLSKAKIGSSVVLEGKLGYSSANNSNYVIVETIVFINNSSKSISTDLHELMAIYKPGLAKLQVDKLESLQRKEDKEK